LFDEPAGQGASCRLSEPATRPNDAIDLLQEPRVNPGQLVDPFDRDPPGERFCDGKDPLGRRLPQLLLEISEPEMAVPDEPDRADLEHPDRLLKRLLEAAPDGHHLADGLHAGPDLS